MDSYLMMLYVTLEQESAMKILFMDQGWAFCKPDLSVTTDKLGPAIGGIPTDNQGNGSSSGLKNKRKSKSSLNNAPVIKQAKIVPVASATMSKKQTVSLKNADTQNDGINEASNACTSPVNISTIVEEEGGRKILIKVETTDRDYEDNDDVNADDDDMNADDDDTDVDYSFDEIEDRETGAELDVSEASENKDSKTGVIPKTLDECSEDEPGIEEEEDGDVITVASLQKTYFPCHECGRRYSSRSILQRHLKKHLSAFYCKSCSMAFNSAEDKDRHYTEKHTQQFSCATCDKVFKRKNSLNMHVESVHLDIQRFPCTWVDCEKSFNRQDVLNDHVNTHTGQRPHTCQKCYKTYSSKSSLNHHWKACKTNGLACRVCGQVLSSRSGLNDHIQGMHVKRPLPCVCGQVFTWRNNLLKHKKHCSVFYDSQN